MVHRSFCGVIKQAEASCAQYPASGFIRQSGGEGERNATPSASKGRPLRFRSCGEEGCAGACALPQGAVHFGTIAGPA